MGNAFCALSPHPAFQRFIIASQAGWDSPFVAEDRGKSSFVWVSKARGCLRAASLNGAQPFPFRKQGLSVRHTGTPLAPILPGWVLPQGADICSAQEGTRDVCDLPVR